MMVETPNLPEPGPAAKKLSDEAGVDPGRSRDEGTPQEDPSVDSADDDLAPGEGIVEGDEPAEPNEPA